MTAIARAPRRASTGRLRRPYRHRLSHASRAARGARRRLALMLGLLPLACGLLLGSGRDGVDQFGQPSDDGVNLGKRAAGFVGQSGTGNDLAGAVVHRDDSLGRLALDARHQIVDLARGRRGALG